MGKQSKLTRKRPSKSGNNSRKANKGSEINAHQHEGDSFVASKNVALRLLRVFAVVLALVTCALLYSANTRNIEATVNISESQGRDEVTPEKETDPHASTMEQYKDFTPRILKQLKMKAIDLHGTTMNAKYLRHNYNDESSVRAYTIDNFMSAYECDSLAKIHDVHVRELNRKFDPILCFDSLQTFGKHLNEMGLSKQIKVSNKDFTQDTTCINESLSSHLKNYMKWSYSISFYPGESKFSLTLAQRIEMATGLFQKNGGKFQITSYPQNVGYKNHTDCSVGVAEKRDRFATILVYLKDVAQGGETVFPQLGLSVKPKKGMALVWNSMTSDGECEPSSLHNAARVIEGQKYILQRWYYYHSFPSLGKRFPEPRLPARKANQPRVSCDEYEFGSCRWYDEWNYDHLTEYAKNKHNYV